jgi:hypothetical protein
MTRADAMFYHCWLVTLVQTYVSLVFSAPRLASPCALLTYTFPLSHGISYKPGTLSSNPSLADISICAVFFFGIWSVLISITFLQKSSDFTAVGVMKRCHGCTFGLFVFQLQSQVFCGACLISLWLYAVCLKACSRCSSFSPRLSASHSVASPSDKGG